MRTAIIAAALALLSTSTQANHITSLYKDCLGKYLASFEKDTTLASDKRDAVLIDQNEVASGNGLYRKDFDIEYAPGKTDLYNVFDVSASAGYTLSTSGGDLVFAKTPEAGTQDFYFRTVKKTNTLIIQKSSGKALSILTGSKCTICWENPNPCDSRQYFKVSDTQNYNTPTK